MSSERIRIRVTSETSSGRRRGWHKRVTAVDRERRGGYALKGEFLRDGLHDVPAGTVIVETEPTGSVKRGGMEARVWRIVPAAGGGPDDRVDDGGPWEFLREVEDWYGESPVVLDAVEAALAELAEQQAGQQPQRTEVDQDVWLAARESTDRWSQLWALAVGEPEGDATITLGSRPEEVVLTYADGTRAAYTWHAGRWRHAGEPSAVPGDVAARDAL